MTETEAIFWFLVLSTLGRAAIICYFEFKAWLRKRNEPSRNYVMPGPKSRVYPWNRKREPRKNRHPMFDRPKKG